MSLANVYPYFRARLNTLGFKEWQDGFNRENIPSTVIDGSYHILTPSASGGTINQNHQNVEVSLTVQLVFKGYRYPSDAKEKSLVECEKIIKDICSIQNRTSQLLNVVFNGFSMSALNASDDNQVLLELDFTGIVILGMR